MSGLGRVVTPASDQGSEALDRKVGVALFVAAVVLPLLRQPGVHMWDTIWVEDGPVYTQQANADGPFHVLFRGYAGYLQLVPRLLAVPTAWVPARTLAVYLALSSTFLCALLAAFLYRSTRGWIHSVVVRLAVATMFVIGPAVAIETTGTVTNTIWFLLAVTPWAVVSVLDGRRDVVLRSAVVFAAATSTIVAALFLPLALVVALRRRTRAAWAVLAAFVAGTLVQLAVVAHTAVAPRDSSSLRVLADFFGLRVLGSLLVGERPLDQLWTGVGEPVVVVFVLVTVAIFAVAFRGAGRRNQRLAGVFLAYAVVVYALPMLGRGTSIVGFGIGRYTLDMTRYTLAPILALLSAVAVLVDGVGVQRRRRVADTGRKVLLVQIAMVLAIGFVTPTVRGDGPGWTAAEARAYAQACRSAPADTVVSITTTPSNFRLELTCGRLRP